jgi:hypothetical protein
LSAGLQFPILQQSSLGRKHRKPEPTGFPTLLTPIQDVWYFVRGAWKHGSDTRVAWRFLSVGRLFSKLRLGGPRFYGGAYFVPIFRQEIDAEILFNLL